MPTWAKAGFIILFVIGLILLPMHLELVSSVMNGHEQDEVAEVTIDQEWPTPNPEVVIHIHIEVSTENTSQTPEAVKVMVVDPEETPQPTSEPVVTPAPSLVKVQIREIGTHPTPAPAKAEVEEDVRVTASPQPTSEPVVTPAPSLVKVQIREIGTHPTAAPAQAEAEEDDVQVANQEPTVVEFAGESAVSITKTGSKPPPLADPKDYGLPTIAERKAALEAAGFSDETEATNKKEKKSIPAVCMDMKRLKRDLVQNQWEKVPRDGWFRFIEGWIDYPGYTNKLQKFFVKPNQKISTRLGGAIYVLPKRCGLDQAEKLYKQMPQPSWGKSGHKDDIKYLRRVGLVR